MIASPTNAVTTQHPSEALIQRLANAIIESSIDRLLKRARKTSAMSLKDIAEVLDVSRAHAHQLEQANTNLQLETLQRAADALGYDVQITFVPRNGDKPTLTAPVHSR